MGNDSLKAFKDVSRRCFQFLIDELHFIERPLQKDLYNQYIEWRNDEIS